MANIKIVQDGEIKKLLPEVGFVQGLSTNETYEFAKPKDLNLSVGDVVTFELKTKENTNSMLAANLKIKTKTKKVTKKGEYVFANSSEKKNVIEGVILALKSVLEDSSSTAQKRKVTKGDEEELATLYEDCEDLLGQAQESLESKDLNQTDLISKVQEFTSRTHLYKKDISFVWKQWKDNEKEFFEYENSKGMISYTDKGANEQIHEYDEIQPKTHWPLVKIKQKEKVFYIASASVWDIARTAYVPSLPPKLGVEETANRILEKTKKQDEWQREADMKRVRKITDFIGRSNNIIANAPMLYINDSKHANINIHNGADRLTIDFGFLKEKRGKFVDRHELKQKDEFGNTQYKDYRPMWLIDGQHRIKGIHQNEQQSQKLIIPVVIFPKRFGATDTAKVFAEINTLQEPLPDLHELFMQHRFSIDHVNPKKKFIDYRGITLSEYHTSGGNSDDWMHSRANTLSYEILAKLSKKGALKNRVKFLNQNENNEIKQNALIDAKQWINYTRSWFYSAPYPYDTTKNLETEINTYYKEISNYFEAWAERCNHDGWEDNQERWTNTGNKKGLIQQKLYFIVLLNLFNLVHRITQDNQDSPPPISKDDFLDTLKPFKWVDWIHRDLKDTYKGGGEKGRGSLEVWMADALLDYFKNKKTYDKTDILNTNIKSKAGRGITSILKKAKFRAEINEKPVKIENNETFEYPRPKKPVKIYCMRPANARYKAEWRVIKEDGTEVSFVSRSVGKHRPPEESEFELKHEKWMNKQHFIQVECSWYNASTETPKPRLTFITPPDLGMD